MTNNFNAEVKEAGAKLKEAFHKLLWMAGAAKRHYSTGSIKSGSFRSLCEKIACIGASRTDAGVHALGNVAVFDTDARMPDRIAFALNTRGAVLAK